MICLIKKKSIKKKKKKKCKNRRSPSRAESNVGSLKSLSSIEKGSGFGENGVAEGRSGDGGGEEPVAPILVHLSSSSVMVEYGNPSASEFKSTASRLVITPLTPRADAEWVRFLLACSIVLGTLTCLSFALELAEFRFDPSFRCVKRPLDNRSKRFYLASVFIFLLAVAISVWFHARFVLLLWRQRGFRSFGLYALWFVRRIKLALVSILVLSIIAITPPFLMDIRYAAVAPALLVFFLALDYTVVFHNVAVASIKGNLRAVKVAMCAVGATAILTVVVTIASVHECSSDGDVSIRSWAPVMGGDELNEQNMVQHLCVTAFAFSLAFAMISLSLSKFRKPHRPAPTLESDEIAAVPPDADGIVVVLFQDRIKALPHYDADGGGAAAALGMPAIPPTVVHDGPAALDTLTVEKTIVDEAEPTWMFEERVMSARRAKTVTVILMTLNASLAAVLLARVVRTFVVAVPPAVRSTCIKSFDVGFLDWPPIAIGAALMAAAAIGSGLQPGHAIDLRTKATSASRTGCLPVILAFLRYFAAKERALVVMSVAWVGLEVLDFAVIKTGFFVPSTFLNLVFHVVLGPCLMLSVSFHFLVLSPHSGLFTRVHSWGTRAALFSMLMDLFLLYFKLYVARSFTCNNSQQPLTSLATTTLTVTVSGYVLISLARKYVQMVIYPTRPCMSTGSRTKFLIIENVVTYSATPMRRRRVTHTGSEIIDTIPGSPRMISQTVTASYEPGKSGVVVMKIETPALAPAGLFNRPMSIFDEAHGAHSSPDRASRSRSMRAPTSQRGGQIKEIPGLFRKEDPVTTSPKLGPIMSPTMSPTMSSKPCPKPKKPKAIELEDF
jgi:hypothetical protein